MTQSTMRAHYFCEGPPTPQGATHPLSTWEGSHVHRDITPQTKKKGGKEMQGCSRSRGGAKSKKPQDLKAPKTNYGRMNVWPCGHLPEANVHITSLWTAGRPAVRSVMKTPQKIHWLYYKSSPRESFQPSALTNPTIFITTHLPLSQLHSLGGSSGVISRSKIKPERTSV